MFFHNFYHVYNRGVEKRKIFQQERDYKRFILGMRVFNDTNFSGSIRDEVLSQKSNFWNSRSSTSGKDGELVEVVAYCLNPNHYHLLLKEVSENGLAKYIQKLSTGYTNYFNKKYERSGALFQGKYKKAKISSNEQLLFLSAYVNANHYIHSNGRLGEWDYCSLPDYMGERDGNLCFKYDVLEQFNNSKKDYENFCKMICNDTIKRREFAKSLLE